MQIMSLIASNWVNFLIVIPKICDVSGSTQQWALVERVGVVIGGN